MFRQICPNTDINEKPDTYRVESPYTYRVRAKDAW